MKRVETSSGSQVMIYLVNSLALGGHGLFTASSFHPMSDPFKEKDKVKVASSAMGQMNRGFVSSSIFCARKGRQSDDRGE